MNYLVLSNLQHNGVFYPQHSILVNDGVLNDAQLANLLNNGVLKQLSAPTVLKANKAQNEALEEVEDLKSEDTTGDVSAETVAQDDLEPNIEWGKRRLLAYAQEHGIEVSKLDSREVMVDKIKAV